MRVLLVEDNWEHAQEIIAHLRRSFDDVAVAHMETEWDVRQNLPKIVSAGPDIIFLDIILPWCRPSPDMPPPPDEIVSGNPYRAGLRCLDLFLSESQLSGTPILVHSVLDPERIAEGMKSVPDNVVFLRKPTDWQRILVMIESLMHRLPPKRKRPSGKKRFLDATELKIGLKDFKIDLKKLMGDKG